MDQPWDHTLHHPTIQATRKRWDRSLTHGYEVTASSTQLLTETIAQLPYDPTLWLLRAQLLLSLGYPELAAGDAYKARLLIQAAIQESKSPLGSAVRLQLGYALYFRYYIRTLPQLLKSNGEVRVPNDTTSVPIDETLATTLQNHKHASYTILLISLQHANDFHSALSLALDSSSPTSPSTSVSTPQSDEDDDPGSKVHITELRAILHAKRQACEQVYASSPAEIETAVRNGSVIARRYPWMRESGRHRGKEMVEEMGRDVSKLTQGKCLIKKSEVSDGEIGVFAAKTMGEGEVLCVEAPEVLVSGSAMRCVSCCAYVGDEDARVMKCCGRRSCNKDCAEDGATVFHQEKCGRLREGFFCAGLLATLDKDADEGDEPEISQRSTHTNTRMHNAYLSLAARTLSNAGSTHTRSLHPLTSVPAIARLVANYNSSTPRPFRLSTHIASPIAFLIRQCDVDIFADARFDTWVLHTIRLRIENNEAQGFVPVEKERKDRGKEKEKHEGSESGNESVYIQGMWNAHSAMNHSCDPNVEWVDCLPSKGARKGRVGLKMCRTLRKIDAGEELCHAYLDVQGIGDCAERAAVLAPWVGDVGCACVRCRRERADG